MARRAHQLFDSLSFLDVVFGALGAILFLFIVVDKGGIQELPATAKYFRVYLNADTSINHFHGELPDSIHKQLALLPRGTPVLVVIKDIVPLPRQESCPPCITRCPPCNCNGNGPRCPNPEDHLHVCPNEDEHRFPRCPNPEDHNKLHCDDPQCEKNIVYTGDPIELAYKIGFSLIDNDSYEHDLDLMICREGGNVCVPSPKSQKTRVEDIVWLDQRIKDFLGKKARTGGEIVLIEKTMAAGIYAIKAKFDLKKGQKSGSASVTATAATKHNKKIKAVQFNATLAGNQTWTTIGRVEVDANGNIKKLPF